MNELYAQSGLTNGELIMFQGEMAKRRKTVSGAVLWCLFFGGLGGHHFYLGNTTRGMIYVLFCWTFIPLLFAIFEIFSLDGAVKKHNENAAKETVDQIRNLRAFKGMPGFNG